MTDIKLSNDFLLSELLKSQEASRKNIIEQFNPPQNIIDSLTILCQKVLQPLRNAINSSISVNSGYRCPKVNKAIGGAKGSQHEKGQAADIELFINGTNSNFRLAQEIIRSKIIFDQMILEFGTFEKPAWIHVSYDSTKTMQRGQILRAETVNGKTVYSIIEADKIWH